jgi:hypothetical protein
MLRSARRNGAGLSVIMANPDEFSMQKDYVRAYFSVYRVPGVSFLTKS